MKFTADLHIHSRFSRATSRDLTLPNLHKWGQLKGLDLIGTGDFTHPVWFQEIQEQLEEIENTGIFRLKPEFASLVDAEVPARCRRPVYFMLTVEISNIYKRNGRTRKIHHVVCAPSMEIVAQIRHELGKIGNLNSDGRPILGLDSRDMLEIFLGISERIYLIPAHIWTPWFSLFGSKSGFDTIEECFADLSSYIFAAETGLSSDPVMNWRCSQLDRLTMISNSDAHSPGKLAREANWFDTEMEYDAIFDALKTGDPKQFLGTIEFFPEEGKYHLDGHRKCAVRLEPEESIRTNGLCPVCNKPLTLGVLHRVNELADRPFDYKPDNPYPFASLVGLETVLSDSLQTGAKSKKVQREYWELMQKFGSELDILQNVAVDEIERASSLTAEAIRRVRNNELLIDSGFDGEFGVIKIFEPGEQKKYEDQTSFFSCWEPTSKPTSQTKSRGETLDKLRQKRQETPPEPKIKQAVEETTKASYDYNEEQKAAIYHTGSPLVIVAGPGTGKTRTLTARIEHLIQQGISPDSILAITFTNKAAQELEERLIQSLEEVGADIFVCTFHRLGQSILQEHGERIGLSPEFTLITREEVIHYFRHYTSYDKDDILNFLEIIAKTKTRLEELSFDNEILQQFSQDYQNFLKQYQMVDLEDLIFLPTKILRQHPEVVQFYQEKIKAIAIDEYQDLNLVQYEMFRLLCSEQCDLCVIGDPDQSIYGIPGSSSEYFLNFTTDFPEAKKISLKTNYRCAQSIVTASQELICNNIQRIPCLVEAGVSEVGKIFWYSAPSEESQAEFIVKNIESTIGGTSYFSLDSDRADVTTEASLSFADFAILYRTKQQCEKLEEALSRSGMPYRIVGDRALMGHKSVQQFITFLRFLCHPENSHCGSLLLPHLSGVGKKTLEQVQKANLKNFADVLEIPKLAKKAKATIDSFLQFTENIKQQKYSSLDKLIEEIANKHKLFAFPEDIQNHLMKVASSYSSLHDLLNCIQLQVDGNEDFSVDRIQLLTMHAAKGLEFPVVFLCGVEDGLIPYIREGCELEEERRLFYVGLTRAKSTIYLTQTKKRRVFGKMTETKESRFLQEIPSDLVKDLSAKKKKKKQAEQMSLF